MNQEQIKELKRLLGEYRSIQPIDKRPKDDLITYLAGCLDGLTDTTGQKRDLF